ncbi:MAG: mechanosensitive ion channel family protein [Bacillota bacterium]
MLEWLNYTIYGEVTWFRLISALLVFFVALVMSKMLTAQLRKALMDRMEKESLELMTKIIFYGIMVVAIIWIMPNIGIEPSGLLVAGGIVGLAVGFASQSIIGNLISGIFLMGERPVKLGDLVEISGNLGFVEDIQIISTSIRTLEGNFVRIPNETVFTSNITNYTSNPVRRFEYTVGISYADDAEKAMQVIKDLVREHPLVLINPAPQIYVDSLGDSSVDIIVRIWSPSTEWFGVKMEMLWKIKKAIEAAGIEIPFPQRVIWQGTGRERDVSPETSGLILDSDQEA